jgi:hypothetical protein
VVPWLVTGIGGNFTFYATPAAIHPYYGDHPTGFIFFLRARIKGSEPMTQMHHGG